MQPKEFISTLYLGDRGCKSILIDGWNGKVMLQVSVISRVRSASGQWDYYTGEDIPDGLIVFSGVTAIRFAPSGPLPNDLINSLDVEPIPAEEDRHGDASFLFRIWVDSVGTDAKHVEVEMQIEARVIHLEDPARPGVTITH